LKKSKLLALELGESTDIQNNGILLKYVRYIDHDESEMKEDILHFKCFWITYAHYQQWNFQSFK